MPDLLACPSGGEPLAAQEERSAPSAKDKAPSRNGDHFNHTPPLQPDKEHLEAAAKPEL